MDKHHHLGLLFHGLIMWPVHAAGKEQKWLIWSIKVKHHTASTYNRLNHCFKSPSVQDPYGDGSHVYVVTLDSK